MTDLRELIDYCNTLLACGEFEDYCPNGLQVDAGTPILRRLVSGVTASQALIEAAAEQGADLLLVHHGFFWKGEPAPLVGPKGRRIATLMRRGINLAAYHLPLDAHPELGNNRLLGEALGLPDPRPLRERGLLWGAELAQPLTPAELAARIGTALARPPLHLSGGRASLRRLAWCSGGAARELERAAALGFDAYITGEPAEPSSHLARELGIEFFAAGHHATERLGVRALGEHLAARFDLEHCFIDIPNPV
jgi:dinuclear metal center YbgI/SA1388 family protein